MSSFLFDLLVLAFSCQATAIAASSQGEKRKLIRTEMANRQQAVHQQYSSNVALELGSSGGLIRSAEASRKDAHLQTVGVHDLASASMDSSSTGASAAPAYGFVDTDSRCEDNGMVTLTSVAECEQAASALGYLARDKDGKVSSSNYFDRPYGCTWHRFGNVEFWSSGASTTLGCTHRGYAGCLCRVQQEPKKGDHSIAFTKAYDTMVTELELKQATLADWLSVNCITTKEKELADKQKEIMDYKGESDYWWESAWSAVKRMWLNLWFDKANRLLSEEATLQAELDGMKAEKARLEKEVADMVAKKTTHVDEANVLLDGLNSQVAALVADLASYRSDKTNVQTTHDELKEKTIEEDAAAVDVFTQLIANLDKAIHEKRDIFYSVTATCAQYEKEGKDECRKCTSDKRACGDTCIAKSDLCNTFPGCACDDTIGHDLHQEFNETKTALEDTIKYHEGMINSHSSLLDQNQKDMEKITADKAIADKAFDTEKARLEALGAQLEKDKSMSEGAKQNTTNQLASATEENEAAVAELASDLRSAILALMASKAENVASRAALLAAQATKMKELLETHATTIAGWDAKISAAEKEKAGLQSEAGDLNAAIATTGGLASRHR